MIFQFRWNRSIQRPQVIRMLILSVAITAVSGCSLLPQEAVPLAPPLVKPVDAVSRTIEVKLGTIEHAVHGVGTLESTTVAYQQFEEAGGVVDEVFVQAGQEVRAGDVLVRLEMEDMELDLLKKELDVKKKEQALQASRNSEDTFALDIALLELHIATLELDDLKRRINETELHASMDGIIIFDAGIEPGDTVEQHQVLYTIAKPDELRIAFTTPLENTLQDIHVGTAATVNFNGDDHHGIVVQTPAETPLVEDERLKQKDAQTVRIEMESLPADVQIGDWGDVKIVLNKREDTIVLPIRALRENFGRTYVQLLEGEIRREADVVTGLRTATEVEIIKGLEIGQQVVLP